MKIAIYEINHLEWVLPLCKLLEPMEHEVFLFTSSDFEFDIKENLGQSFSSFNWTFISRRIGKFEFLKKVRSFLNVVPYNIILLNTVDSQHGLLFSAINNKNSLVVVNIHDINNLFMCPSTLSFRIWVRTLGKRLLAKRTDAFIVNFEGMMEYIQGMKFTAKPVYHFAPVYAEPQHLYKNKTTYSVLVPGSIDNRRRDYDMLLTAWGIFGNKSAELTLAGCPIGKYGDLILKRAAALNEQGYKIKFFLEEIPEKKFQQLVSNATLIVAPTVVYTSIHDCIKERYGRSKYSGNIYDAMRFGKPLFITHGIGVPNTYRESCRFFSNAKELSALFNMPPEILKALSIKAIEQSQQLTIEKTRYQLQKLLLNLKKIKEG